MSGYEHGYTAGHEDGVRQGWDEAREENANELARLQQQANGLKQYLKTHLSLSDDQLKEICDDLHD